MELILIRSRMAGLMTLASGLQEYGNVHNYLIKTPGPYSMEELEAYRSLEAYN